MGLVPADDLRDFTNCEFPAGLILQPVSYAEFTGSSVAYVAQRKLCIKQWLQSGSLLLFVTYNSKALDCALEMDEVKQMISTLKPK